MAQTAVEWLLENLITEPYSENDFKHNEECWDKAEEMEKQQIIKANRDGIDMVIDKKNFVLGEQYYNETFKSE